MSRENKNERNRRIGAIIGLVLGISVMYAIGQVGLVPAFILGAGGCLAGGMIGERIGPPQSEVTLPSRRNDHASDSAGGKS